MCAQARNERSRLALHACCGPCLLEPFDALVAEGYDPVIVFANPNIEPKEEYALRLATLRSYAESRGMRVVEIDTGDELWRAATSGLERPARCHACYRVRLGLVSGWAAENGIELVATTLSVSPYQDAAAIAREGANVAQAVGVRFLERDYRDRYADATRRSRDLGMYRQNYCGCLASKDEAAAERAARRQARKAGRPRD